MTMTKIKFEICLAKFGHKPDEKFDFLFVFNMLCHVSAFSILCIYDFGSQEGSCEIVSPPL